MILKEVSEFSIDRNEEYILITINDDLDFFSKSELDRIIKNELNTDNIVVIDTTKMIYIDSFGLAILLNAKKKFKLLIIIADEDNVVCSGLRNLDIIKYFIVTKTLQKAEIIIKECV